MVGGESVAKGLDVPVELPIRSRLLSESLTFISLDQIIYELICILINGYIYIVEKLGQKIFNEGKAKEAKRVDETRVPSSSSSTSSASPSQTYSLHPSRIKCRKLQT